MPPLWTQTRQIRPPRPNDRRHPDKKIGNVHKKKKPPNPDVDAWRSCLYAAINAKRPMTVDQVAAWFHRKVGHPLPDGLLGTPDRGDIKRTWFVKDVFPWLKPRRARAA
jgi:hypothetical protein